MKYLFNIALLGTLFIAMGCGGGESAPEVPAAPETAAAPEAPASSSGQEVVIRPVGDQLKFETEAFTVKAGTEVILVMDNVATLEAMQHNVVILQVDTDVNTIGIAAMSAGPDNEYIPDDPAVLFYTPLAKPGERVEVVFTAPAPGEYTFICTFPGHYAAMQGVMRVVE